MQAAEAKRLRAPETQDRPRILALVSYYVPGFKAGGPVTTIRNMTACLASDFEFLVLTRDRDAGDTQPYCGVPTDSWTPVPNASVLYASPGNQNVRQLARLINETPHDLLYLNSFFDPVFALRPLVARRLGWLVDRPVVVAPRGEFSAGAIGLKRWKKVPSVAAARASGMCEGLVWHASGEGEAADIRRVMGTIASCVMVAPDLPSAAVGTGGPVSAFPGAGTSLRVVFVSRIDRKKNLDYALRVLSKVSVRAEFDIYGPIWDRDYWQECRGLIERLPGHICARYRGALRPEDVPAAVAGYDLMLFPTRGENFGHVIIEALSCGTPVVISDTTPWEDDGSGACVALPLSREDGFVDAVMRFAEMPADQRQARRQAARAIGVRFAGDARLLDMNHRLFSFALRDGISEAE